MKRIVKKTLRLACAITASFTVTSCAEEFLALKQDRNAAVPSTLADFQAFLDNVSVMNHPSVTRLGYLGADECYVSDASWANAIYEYERQAYLWADDVYVGGAVPDWEFGYKRILHANIVLDGLASLEVTPVERDAYRLARGSALFFRGLTFFELAQLFCAPYPVSGEPSPTALGIPLRLEADVTAKASRATLQETYDRIIADLREAAAVLSTERKIDIRPSKPAAHALLARVYLQMGRYADALRYADSTLSVYSDLVDFNTIDTLRITDNLFDGLRLRHPEVIYMGSALSPHLMGPYSNLRIDTNFRKGYAEDDLRRTVYFKDYVQGMQLFRGSYRPEGNWFTGLAVNELLLIKAESHARLGEAVKALQPLNRLLANRMAVSAFVPLASADAEAIIARVVAERRKELVLRGLRWNDLRRLNQEPRFATTLVRVIDGTRYELPPGSPRYTWPIPEETVRQSGVPQNER